MEEMYGFRYLYGLIHLNIPLLGEPCMSMEWCIHFTIDTHDLHRQQEIDTHTHPVRRLSTIAFAGPSLTTVNLP